MKFENDSALTERCASSKLIFDGKVLHLYADDITLPNGKQGYREYIHHNGAVAVVPLTDDGKIICVRQYRYANRRVTLEIPAGKLEGAEDHRVAALRELREETGARCASLTYIGEFLSTPAILDEKIDLYLAEGLTFGDTDFDEDEFIEIVRLPLAELVDRVMDGTIRDGKTQVAILKTQEILRRRANAEQ